MEEQKNNNSAVIKTLLWILLILVPPAGIIYLWISKDFDYSKRKKKTLSWIFGIYSFILISGIMSNLGLLQDNEQTNIAISETTTQTNVTQFESELTNESTITNEYDELQQLYLNFDTSMTYQEALEFIQNTGLPYSEAQYNGSRKFQVAFTEGCTAQKYKKESGPYIEIIYRYLKNDDNSNEDNYIFGTCAYNPVTGTELIIHNYGHYFGISEKGTYIYLSGNIADNFTNITREKQIEYYLNNQF